MSYILKFAPEVGINIKKLKKSGNKSLYNKLEHLLEELQEHPETGTGKPEQLKYYEVPTWSRRLSKQHRIVYEIQDNVLTVLVLDILGHYNKK
ncbi:MAG: Txe/YoeB family addiction module toxin [Flavobacteriaceae bacterium]|jgi:toxin YoeB|nr:Txe/YoeB family addiction module toxin [Flavobacteriaceae bacterium]